MDKSTIEDILTQLFYTKNKQFKIAFNFLTGYNGVLINVQKKQ